MKLLEAVEKMNSGELKVPELAKMLNCSKDLLGDILKENGFVYIREEQKRKFVGDGDPQDQDLNLIIKERISNKGPKKRRQSVNKNQKKVEEKSDLSLTENEINWVKLNADRYVRLNDEFKLNFDFSELPPRKPSKKVPYEISEKTYKEFEEFSEKVGEPRRMSRNDLVEMALQRFMIDFRGLKYRNPNQD